MQVLHNLIQAQESNSLLLGIQTTGGFPSVSDAQVMSINPAGYVEPPTPAAPKPANSLSSENLFWRFDEGSKIVEACSTVV